MHPPNIIYSSILMAAGVACLLVTVVVWNTVRGVIGSKSLTVLLLALSWWDITYAIFWIDFPGPIPYFWLDHTLTGAFIVPTALFVFSLEHTHLQNWLTRPIRLMLWIEPILAFILLWTDRWHNLYFGGKRALNTTMILDAGMVHWVNVYYSYALILISLILLGWAGYRSMGIYRKQTLMIMSAMIVPWIVHIGFISNGGLLPNADPTPFIFSITAIIFAFALIRYRLLDIMPIARSVLIENMSEGIVVLDAHDRVVDINPVAAQVAGLSMDDTIGETAEKVFAQWKDIAARYQSMEKVQVEVVVDDVFLDLNITPLLDNANRYIGRLIVWRDISDLKRTQAKLEKLATIDGLTEVFNRRSFLEKAHLEINRASRHKNPLSVVLMDVDHFKNINDVHGHPSGDQVLINFARVCMENIREFDVFARFGGEEFALLMPETDDEQAYQVSERLRLSVAQSSIYVDDQAIPVTVSLGLSEFSADADTLDDILRRADQALYHAKQSGRNQTVVWQKSIVEQ